MEKFCIDVLGAKVRYISDIPIKDFFIVHKDFMEFFNPKFIADNDDIEYTVEYHDVEDISNPIVVDGKRMVVNYPASMLTESIILYLGFHFLEKQFGEMGMCSCHSACIAKDGVAVLLIGEAGAGKTSIAVNACKNRGFSLISNDMTLIGTDGNDIIAYGGTKFINLRLLSVKKNMPFLLHLFDNDNMDQWTNKLSVMARDIDIKENYDPTAIKTFLFIHVDDREELKVSNGNSWRNNFLLYQNVSSHIRGSAATFIDKRGYPIGYIPSQETKETYDKRIRLLNMINVSERYYYVSGKLADILNFIDRLYQEEKEQRLERKKNYG